MEDFGYQKDDGQNHFPTLIKKTFLVCATLFSIACFIYITVSAYYFVYQEKNNDIETIKSPEGPIKVLEDEKNTNNGNSMQIDRSIYEDIFGNKKESLKQENAKIRNAPEPALPPKLPEMKAQLVKESAAIVSEKPTTSATKKSEVKEQKIVVYSDQNKGTVPAKDLLTKTNGEERVAAVPVAKAMKKRAVRVQVAAMTSKNAAEENWSRLKRLYSNLFSGLEPFTEEVNLGKRGIFYRLQVGNFYNQIEAEEFCDRYVSQAKKTRADCIVVE